jgi:hypothetical protein
MPNWQSRIESRSTIDGEDSSDPEVALPVDGAENRIKVGFGGHAGVVERVRECVRLPIVHPLRV